MNKTVLGFSAFSALEYPATAIAVAAITINSYAFTLVFR